MLLPLLLLLAASLPGPVQGDFDHDGLIDTARIRSTGSDAHDLEIIRGATPSHPTRVARLRAAPDYLQLNTTHEDGVATACGKDLGTRRQPCPNPKVDLRKGDLVFGSAESSEAVVLWDGKRFQVQWLTD